MADNCYGEFTNIKEPTEAGMNIIAGSSPVAAMDRPHPDALEGADLLIFLERPGRAGDGRYYNMRGRDISASVVPLDDLAAHALERGLPVIGIGDGGNEPEWAPFTSR